MLRAAKRYSVAGCHFPPLPFTGDCGLRSVFPSPYSFPHSGRVQQPRVSLSEPVAAQNMTLSSLCSSALRFSCPHRWLSKAVSPPWNCSTLEIAESGTPSLPTAFRPSSPLLVPCGARVPDSAGHEALLPPRLPLFLHFPPSPAEVPWSIIRALFCQHPQLSWLPISWSHPAGRPPALEESQQPPAQRHPPPPLLLGAKLGKPAAASGG